MKNQQLYGWCLVCLVATSSFLPALAYPSTQQLASLGQDGQEGQQRTPYQGHTEERKFAEKPNSIKKIAALEDRNDLDDLSTNQISVSFV